MPVDPDSYVPAYKQIADDLRGKIQRGDLAPGVKLPPEDHLAHQYEVGKDTLRDALAELRSEGLVRTLNRIGSYVREQAEPDVVPVDGPARIRARMPTPEERRRLRLDEGVPVLVLDVDGRERIMPADTTELDINAPGTSPPTGR